MAKNAVLSLSGGMDSSTLLLHLLANGYRVTTLSFDYGQKHRVELERATSLVEYINEIWNAMHPPFDNDKNYSFLPPTHQIIKLDGLKELLNSALVEAPKLLIADELSLGLAPVIVKKIYDQLARLRANGTALLIVEQQVGHALKLCERAIILEHGCVAWAGTSNQATERLAMRFTEK